MGADTILTVAPGQLDPPVWRCTNPFAATGGADAETAAQIRDRAPQQFRAGLLSLTGPADYEAAALSFCSVRPREPPPRGRGRLGRRSAGREAG